MPDDWRASTRPVETIGASNTWHTLQSYETEKEGDSFSAEVCFYARA